VKVPSPAERLLRRNAPVYLILCLGLGLTLLVARYVKASVELARERRFSATVEDVRGAVAERMEVYLTILRGARGLFATGVDVRRDTFRAYVESLDLQRHFPGIQGVGFAERIPPERLRAHEARLRAEGLEGYRVWPEGVRELYTAAVYLEPFDWRNQRASGFDMYTEPVRREAMERAARTGQAAASGKVRLVQEFGPEPQPGFVIYLPVERVRPEGEAELAGWVYAPFRTRDLFHGIFQHSGGSRVDFEIFDGERVEPDTLLYDDDGVPRVLGKSSELQRVYPFEVAGRRWTVFFASREGFDAGANRYTWVLVLVLGLVMTGLLSLITRTQLLARGVAEDSARRAAFLAEAGTVLNASLELPATLDQLVRLCVPALADWCSVEMPRPDGQIHLVAVAHRDPALEQQARALRGRVMPKTGGPLSRTVMTGEPVLYATVSPEQLAGWVPLPEARRLLERFGLGSFMCVPMVIRGETLGALILASREPGRFGAKDLQRALDLAGRAAAAVDNARLYEEAQQAIRQREEFLTIAAHELKTPLTSMRLNVQLLVRQLAPEVRDRMARQLLMIERQTVRLNKLVNQLLDVTRAVYGRLELAPEDLDLARLLREEVERASAELEAAGCEVALDLPRTLPGRWDRPRLEQVLTNLLSNAIKYGPKRPIHLSATSDGERATLVVRDEGIGIPAEDLERVFGRFERAVPVHHYGGLGLGLYLCRQFVEAMGGTIRVESEPDKGASFIVELPLRPPEGPLPPGPAADPSGPH
jgi:signal transduction histidine kinase/CHASE1-domain containing sensor protein